MLSCDFLATVLRENNLDFFAGVPDSTFKQWLCYLEDHGNDFTHVKTVNEADGVAVCAGYHLATGKVGIAYMQNSGLGNSVNPITSLVDKEVYSIPVILLIGWRGEPGKKDEPQHKKMGRITLHMLDLLEIPYTVLDDENEVMKKAWENASEHVKNQNTPYAIVVRKGLFESYKSEKKPQRYSLVREEAIGTIAKLLPEKAAIVSTTGKISRELYEYRDAKEQSHKTDFYTVGSMGCSTSIALGIALQKKHSQILVLDGDGAALMHLGAWSSVGAYKPENLKHIILDNTAYESTGAQRTHSDSVDFPEIAKSMGYKQVSICESAETLEEQVKKLYENKGPGLLLVKVKTSSRSDLGRPKTTPCENKQSFMEHLRSL